MPQFCLPDQMTAVVLDSYSGVDALRVEQRKVPEPNQNEVLVRVAASPINPSDLAFLEGRYGFECAPPVVPGGEGSGTVVATGPGMISRYFLGKRVACLWNGKGDGQENGIIGADREEVSQSYRNATAREANQGIGSGPCRL